MRKLNKKEKDFLNFCEELVNSLRNNVVEFNFLKVDGSLRRMLGTRNSDVISKYEGVGSKRDIESNISEQISKDAIVVYDLEAKGFRSFKPSRLVKGSWKENNVVGDTWVGDKDLGDGKKLELINLLVNNEVDIVFTKLDGSERFMKATRLEKFESRMSEINSVSEINKQVESGRVPVYDIDIGEMRAFNLGRLKKYKLSSESVYKDVDFSSEVAIEASEKMDLSNVFNPNDLNPIDLIRSLSNNVVRLVFKKKDGSLRVMYGTRNGEVIDLYSKRGAKNGSNEPNLSDDSRIQAQIDRDYITLFDLQDRGFKTFKPSNLLNFDVENGVVSWLEFDIKDDGWFNVVYDGLNVRDLYIEGKKEAKKIGSEISVKRVKFEYKQKEYKNVRDNLERVGDEEERLSHALKLVDSVVKKVNKDLSSSDLMVYNKLVELGNKVKEKYDEADNKNMVLTEVKILNSKKLVIFNFNWGRDVFIFHPMFAFNGVTYKVYADRTKEIVFEGRARVSKAEKNFLPILKMVVPVIRRRRKKNKLGMKLNETDLRRMRRVYVIYKSKEGIAENLGLKFDFKAQDGVPGILRITTLDRKRTELIATPAYIFDKAKKLMIYERKNDWTTLKDFVEGVYRNPGVLGLSTEQSEFIVKLMALSFDLRKTVTSNGKRI